MSRHRILVIDDDEATHEVLGAYLELSGYQLSHACNGVQGLKLLREEEVDLVLLDVQMPELDGFQTIEQMRRDLRLAELPVLFLTSLDRHNLKVKGLEMGADDYIVKPFNRAEILARIKVALRRSGKLSGAGSALNGQLSAVSVTELLQTMEQGRRSCTINLPDLQGSIKLEQGGVARVTQGEFSGPGALQRILFLEKGRFTLALDEAPPEPSGAATGASFLLLDALTCIDEVNNLLGGHADPDCQVQFIDGSLPWASRSLRSRLPMPSRHVLSLMEGELKENAELFMKAVGKGELVITRSRTQPGCN